MSIIKLSNNALSGLTSFTGSASLGDMVFISSATASDTASIEFDLSTYKEYRFFFINIDPATNNARLMFNLSTDNGSNYNVTKTTSFFDAYHGENGAGGVLRYVTAGDLAQSTSDQRITDQIGNTDGAGAAMMSLFDPSNTTFVKHFLTVGVQANGDTSPTFCVTERCGGYANTTSALTNIIFRMDSGNIANGKILMFGLN
tara:strand:- start:863 stop:1465 length:603 start_codon:yes stop_codon:yes gene_type:complete